MMRPKSTIVAFLCTPLLPSVIAAYENTWTHSSVAQILFWLVAPYLFIGCYVVLLGVPLYFIARRFNKINVWSTIGTGLLIAAALSFASLHGGVSLDAGFNRFTSNGPIGLISALVFWGIWQSGGRVEPARNL